MRGDAAKRRQRQTVWNTAIALRRPSPLLFRQIKSFGGVLLFFLFSLQNYMAAIITTYLCFLLRYQYYNFDIFSRIRLQIMHPWKGQPYMVWHAYNRRICSGRSYENNGFHHPLYYDMEINCCLNRGPFFAHHPGSGNLPICQENIQSWLIRVIYLHGLKWCHYYCTRSVMSVLSIHNMYILHIFNNINYE